MYQLAHYIIEHFPFVWNIAEFFNEKLFLVCYGRRLKHLGNCLENYQGVYLIKEATLEDVQSMVAFFTKQPKESYTYFHPHGFDEKSLRELIKKKSFLMFLVSNSDDEIVGYFFLRCFFNGKCFRGKMVDYRWRGKGIAVLLGEVSTDIASALKLRMFGTISRNNVSSLHSSQASNEIKILEELPDNYLYIEYLPKKE